VAVSVGDVVAVLVGVSVGVFVGVSVSVGVGVGVLGTNAYIAPAPLTLLSA
jgi:hypothetical protein